VTSSTSVALSFESDAKAPPSGMLQVRLIGVGAFRETVPWRGTLVALAPAGMVTRLWSIATLPARSWQLVAVNVEPPTSRIVVFAESE
jgi:hypothetical protein